MTGVGKDLKRERRRGFMGGNTFYYKLLLSIDLIDIFKLYLRNGEDHLTSGDVRVVHSCQGNGGWSFGKR